MRLLITCLVVFIMTTTGVSARNQWTKQEAHDWYAQQPWMVGANYVPANAINQLEMWQAETFDPVRIDKEFGWAEAIGMNTMRVFLHDLLWQQDPKGFKDRLNHFLNIAHAHNIRPMIVLFDSCWDPNPKLGPQHPPTPGIHNSGWVQGPGAEALKDPAQEARLKEYVVGVVSAFANDERIMSWDVWNEPDNGNFNSYGKIELKDKQTYVAKLLPKVFEWARSANPSQPLTSGIWQGIRGPENFNQIEKIQLDLSDVISFHNYAWPEDFASMVTWLQSYGRPLICTEYMARGSGSTFDTILPIAKQQNVAMINWGLVVGKTQTHLPWDSWQRPYVIEQPTIWFHEIFHADGTPYRKREAEVVKELRTTPVAASRVKQ